MDERNLQRLQQPAAVWRGRRNLYSRGKANGKLAKVRVRPQKRLPRLMLFVEKLQRPSVDIRAGHGIILLGRLIQKPLQAEQLDPELTLKRGGRLRGKGPAIHGDEAHRLTRQRVRNLTIRAESKRLHLRLPCHLLDEAATI